MFSPSVLWKAPEINPVNNKARTIPVLNPFCLHGRVFFFSWLGFFIAFWSWYAFPPLLKQVIAADVGMSDSQVLTSNIISLLATLLVRLVAGPCCDLFGARWTFAGCLLVGSIPTFLAGTANSFSEVCALRFFVGILGGSFVPCQVWTTAFFDKNVVGTANSLTGGFGNSGGGVTYFVMPAVYNSLLSNGLSTSKAWRVSFVVPGILIVSVAILLLLCCPDNPNGTKWSERAQAVPKQGSSVAGQGKTVHIAGSPSPDEEKVSGIDSKPASLPSDEKKGEVVDTPSDEDRPQVGEQYEIDAAQQEIIRKPTWKEAMKVILSPQTLVLGACYSCSFGAELAINSVLGSYFGENIPTLSLQGSGNWAAMFGLLNVVFRPLGGLVADYAYRSTKSVWGKKILLHAYCTIAGAFLIAIGQTDPKNLGMLVGLINIGFAFFLEGANGLNFATVPHVHPYANGIVSGFTGASGNFGGIIFAIIFRYAGSYARAIWIIGVIIMAVNALTFWVKPVPKGQIGGR